MACRSYETEIGKEPNLPDDPAVIVVWLPTTEFILRNELRPDGSLSFKPV